MIKIGIQKSGHISDASLSFLVNNGVKIIKNNRLVLEDETGQYQILLLKYKDILPLVESGIIDCGIIGSESILEEGVSNNVGVKDLNFGICRLCLLIKEKNEDFDISNLNGAVVATSYPKAARRYTNSKNVDVKILNVTGSVEVFPNLGLSDVAVDIVETGETARSLGLKIVDTCFDINAVFIYSKKIRSKVAALLI